MKVVEIFNSIEGEGVRAGLPTTFIRLYGCNLECTYCDTRYACNDEGFSNISVAEIVNKVVKIGCQSVTITGGEPLIHDGICSLIDWLVEIGCCVNIETNGTMQLPERYKCTNNVFVTMDYKCPTSGMDDKMCMNTINTLRRCDVLKFVVGNENDLNTMMEVVDAMECEPTIYVSPIFGRIEPAEIVEYLQKHKLYNIRLQLQLHKIVWSPDKRGV